jgi:WD40 repeat protein
MSGPAGMLTAVAGATRGGRPVAVTGARDGSVKLWDVQGGGQLVDVPIAGHAVAVTAIGAALLDDGRSIVVTAGLDHTIRAWDTRSGEAVSEVLTGIDIRVTGLAVARVEGELVVVTCDGFAESRPRIWKLLDGAEIGPRLIGHRSSVPAIAVTDIHGVPVVVTGSADATVRLWNLRTHEPLGRPMTGHDAKIQSVATAEVGEVPVAVSGSSDHTVRVWNLDDHTPIGTLAGHSAAVVAVTTAVVAGRRIAVSASEDQTLRLWDLTDLRPIGGPLPTVGVVNAIAVIDASGPWLVAAGYGITAFPMATIGWTRPVTEMETR